MKVLIRLISILFFINVTLPVIAQSSKIDSLENRLKAKIEIRDEVNTLHILVWELSFYSPEESIEPAKRSLILAQSLNDSTLIARSYNRIGLVHDYAGNFSLAEQNYLKAYQIKRLCDGENETGGLLNNLGSIYYYMGDFEKSMDFYLKSLKIREYKRDPENKESLKHIAQSYNNIGLLLKSQKNYKGALEYYKKAYAIKKELNDFTSLIVTHSNIGVLYMELDSLQMAQNEFNTAIILCDSIGDYVSKAMVYNNIGLLYNRNKNYTLAKINYTKSIDLYDKIQHLHGKATGLINLSSLFLAENNFMIAEDYAKEALQLGESNNAPDITINALQLLSQINTINKPKNALKYLNQYILLKDSINDVNISNKVNQLAVMYKTEKKDAEIDNLENKQLIIQSENDRKDIIISRNKTYVVMLIVGLLFILLLSYFIIMYLRSKKRIIEEQSQRMHEIHQREIDSLRSTLERQVDLPEAKEIKINQTEINDYLLNPLSERELEVLYLIASGLTNKVIGEKLFISVNTVKTHVLKIYEKLDVKNRTAATSKANSLKIIK